MYMYMYLSKVTGVRCTEVDLRPARWSREPWNQNTRRVTAGRVMVMTCKYWVQSNAKHMLALHDVTNLVGKCTQHGGSQNCMFRHFHTDCRSGKLLEKPHINVHNHLHVYSGINENRLVGCTTNYYTCVNVLCVPAKQADAAELPSARVYCPSAHSAHVVLPVPGL